MANERGRRMSRWGIAPLWVVCSLLYGALVGWVQHSWLPDLTMIWPPPTVGWAMGILLIGAGLIIYVAGTRRLVRAWAEDRLETGGVYAWMRHPIYSAFIMFLVPGVVIVLRSVLGLTIPVFMYVLFRVLIRREEQYLAERFGEEYLVWRRRTSAILPAPPPESAL